MNFTLETGIPAITVFLQGLLSFFSPCVLPLLPLYLGYLSGGAKTVSEDGTVSYRRTKVMLNTVFFVLGISFVFFLLGMSFTAAGRFFSQYQLLFTRIGGIVVFFFGLYQLGLFGDSFLNREKRLHIRLDKMAMNPLTALLLGFTFSFAWTPCVGPALASVLILAASSASGFTGFLLIGVYTLGFVLPFLAVGLFTGSLLEFFKKHGKVVRYTAKAGGILMLLIGIMMFTGWMNNISSYLNSISAPLTGNQTSQAPEEQAASDSGSPEPANGDRGTEAAAGTVKEEAQSSDSESDSAVGESDKADSSSGSEQVSSQPAPDFTLTDQFGNVHTLSDYKGKTVFLNFWATWCPPCRAEMPEIQELYMENAENTGDLIILGIASPNIGGEGSEEEITAFMETNGYTYPVVMDTDGIYASTYGISAYPTTFMISEDGSVYGYLSGQLTKDIMLSIIQQTKDGK